MKVISKGIIHGIILDKYGKRGEQKDEQGIPTYSLPVLILDPPSEWRSFALILEDKDAIPVCGFSWIHWCAANIKRVEIIENESTQQPDFVQGSNSFSVDVKNAGNQAMIGYGGMAPPDRPHTYELHVYALDQELELQNGFYMNELYWSMQGHILEEDILRGTYQN